MKSHSEGQGDKLKTPGGEIPWRRNHDRIFLWLVAPSLISLPVFPIPCPHDVRVTTFRDFRWWEREAFQTAEGVILGQPLTRVIESLRGVYNETHCERLVDAGHWQMLLGLFHGGLFDWFGVMMAVGADLAAAPEARDDAQIVDHLRAGMNFWGARVELGCWAGLRRAGIHPTRPAVPKDTKQYEFHVDLGKRRFAIECKGMSRGDPDTNFDLVRNLFEGLVFRRCDATFRISHEASELIRGTQAAPFHSGIFPEVLKALDAALVDAEVGGSPVTVGRYGQIELRSTREPEPLLGRRLVKGHRRARVDARLARLRSTFGDASKKFRTMSEDAHRIALVWTGENYLNAIAVGEFLKRHKNRKRHSLFDFDTGVVLGARSGGRELGWTTEVGSFRINRGEAPPPRELVDGLGDWARAAYLPRG